jgi:hypothetical protein
MSSMRKNTHFKGYAGRILSDGLQRYFKVSSSFQCLFLLAGSLSFPKSDYNVQHTEANILHLCSKQSEVVFH